MSKNVIVNMENEVMFWTHCDRKIANTIVNNILHMWEEPENKEEK